MMYIKNKILFLCLSASVLILAGCQENQSDTIQKVAEQAARHPGGPALAQDTSRLLVHTLPVPAHDRRWGYEIYSGDSLLIRQLQVPAVTGAFGFTSEKDAKTIGEIVAGKLKAGQIPSVSLEELKQSGVAYEPF